MDRESHPDAESPSLKDYLRRRLTNEQLARPLIPSFSHWEFTTTTVGEIAATFLEMNCSPSVALWGDATPVRDVSWTTSNRWSRLVRSASREDRLRVALREFGLPASDLIDPPLSHWSPVAELPEISSTNRSAIRELRYRGAPVGRAILQVHPDDDTPITDEYLWPRRWVESAICSYAWVFDQVHEVIRRRRVSCLVVFNGRFLHDAAAAAAAEDLEIPVLSYDFGGNDTDFDLTADETHDWSALQQRMLDLHRRCDVDFRESVGREWFERRRKHEDPRNAKFVESQRPGNAVGLVSDGPLVVFFSSSGDEVSELELDWSEYFFGQPGAISALADVCSTIPGATLVVRTHPHLRHKPRRDVEEWHEAVAAAHPHLHIDEHSEVDSYSLMDQADVVVTYGSTTGVEAAYAGKPVVVMGPSAYDELGCAVRVTDTEELRTSIAEARPGQRSGALAYGLMMSRRGFRYQHTMKQADGTFCLAGVTLRDSHPLVLHVSDALRRRELEKRCR